MVVVEMVMAMSVKVVSTSVCLSSRRDLFRVGCQTRWSQASVQRL
jgi:hypothetical protein